MNNHDRKVIKKLNNAGVTLMELIVVIAIISVITGTVVLSSSFLFNGRVKKAYNILQSEYSEARTNTMSKVSANDLTITFVDKKYYVEVGHQGKEELIASPFVISYDTSDASGNKIKNRAEIKDSLVISFKRATGGLEPLGGGNEYISALYVNDMALYITPDTGKFSTEYIENPVTK